MNKITMKLNMDKYILGALQEDITSEDITTNSVMREYCLGEVELICKQDGVIAGLDVFKRVFELLDDTTEVSFTCKDGDRVTKGEKIGLVRGDIRVLLSGERTALNFLQRMSGIATYTRNIADLLEGTKTKLLDTRKTTPNMRLLEKYAVACGGGTNHRIGLYDMVMLKDNHIDFAGGIEQAIDRTHAYLQSKGKSLKIEVEVRNMEELERVLQHGGVDRVMLDNFDVPTLRAAVQRIGGTVESEASGGITDATLRSYAETGVDFISVGALTHHIKSLDLSLTTL